MKPNPFEALKGSRKTIVAVVGLLLIGAVYFFGQGTWQEKAVVIGSIAGVTGKFIGAIADEDVAKSNALAGTAAKPEGLQ